MNMGPEEQKAVGDLMGALAKLYPCVGCREDMERSLRRRPPAVQSAHELAQWMCRLHNQVNRKLGKPQFDCSLVDQRWRDGWEDGRCD